MSKKKTVKPREQWQIIVSQRGDWGAINPVTRIIPNKKKNRKDKYKKRYDEE